jgi:hypothetical protein
MDCRSVCCTTALSCGDVVRLEMDCRSVCSATALSCGDVVSQCVCRVVDSSTISQDPASFPVFTCE